MKKQISLLVMAVLVLSVLPMIMAVTNTETSIPVSIITENYKPNVWMCDHRLMFDDGTEPGRMSEDGQILWERMNNYAFEGEQIMWLVLVKDKNGIEKIKDVYATIGIGIDSQGEGNEIEVNCDYKPNGISESIFNTCNAKIDEEELTWEDYQKEIGQTMAAYACTLTVETPDGMPSDEYWVTVEAEDLDGEMGTMDENEYWFFNPTIALNIDGDLTFGDSEDGVRPGTSSYSDTILIGVGGKDDDSTDAGVRLDMFISGTDFYDSDHSGAMCPTTNQLSLGAFRYYATHGAYSTGGLTGDGRADAEGYVPIEYGIGFNDPNPFYKNNEIMQVLPTNGPYWQPNILSPGAEMALTFRLDLPEPCNGDFDTGSIYFWGEAI